MDIPDDIYAIAFWFADHQAQFWSSRKALLNWIGIHGPVRLSDGRLVGFEPDGYIWRDDLVAERMPALITNASSTFTGSVRDIERVVDLITEELPDLEWSVTRKVDTKQANRVLRMGGEAAVTLAECRTPKARLGVTPAV